MQSITMITINGNRMHLCLTPIFTSNISDSFKLWITWQSFRTSAGLMSQTVMVFQITSVSTLSKAFSKSMKIIYRVNASQLIVL